MVTDEKKYLVRRQVADDGWEEFMLSPAEMVAHVAQVIVNDDLRPGHTIVIERLRE